MAESTVRISGLKETIQAFNKLDRSLTKEVQKALKEVAEPVAADARVRIGRYRGAQTRTIKPRSRGASTFVTQGAKKVTGKRGDFGLLQMRRGLIPALEANEDKVIKGVEDALDHLTRDAGF